MGLIMDPSERKLNQRIANRKEKVEKMIAQQEAEIVSIDSASYQHYKDYSHDMGLAVHKLNRLKQELEILKSDRLAQDV